ncbi:hypothetical protein KEM54_006323 [Ascosphaera aggregata]|nr:hypothetical protein KEM54_006323 [Ascosphaera aggregata]
MPTPANPLLLPYTAPQPVGSLTVCTSVIGATSSWLVLRLICDTLYGSDSGLSSELREGRSLLSSSGTRNQTKKVVLVSFLRSLEFWKTEAKRMGLDLNRLSKEASFAFVDGLTELYTPSASSPPPASPPFTGAAKLGRPGVQNLPIRGPPAIADRTPSPAPFTQTTASHMDRELQKLRWTGRPDQSLDNIQREIEYVIDKIKNKEQDGNEVLLLIDQPDLLLAASGGESIGATELTDCIMGLREVVHSTVVTLSADSPLIHNTAPGSTPLEVESASFIASMAYQAQMVMQLRNLDTGFAKDVSGVLRISRGGKFALPQESKGRDSPGWVEKEFLYLLKNDGSPAEGDKDNDHARCDDVNAFMMGRLSGKHPLYELMPSG